MKIKMTWAFKMKRLSEMIIKYLRRIDEDAFGDEDKDDLGI